jgi:hypothetical protein
MAEHLFRLAVYKADLVPLIVGGGNCRAIKD